MRIGLMDSGLGGLTVLHGVAEVLPGADYLYYADTGHAPYGTKPADTVRAHVLDIGCFMASRKVDALVLACNTATSTAVADLRRIHPFPVIGMEPAVKPAVTRAACDNDAERHRVLVLAIPLTLREQKFRDLLSRIDPSRQVDILPAPGLVDLAEKGIFSGSRVEKEIDTLLDSISGTRYAVVVLGCTHFLYFRKSLGARLPPGVSLVDGNEGTVRHLVHVLEETYGKEAVETCQNSRFGHDSVRFFETGGRDMAPAGREWYRSVLTTMRERI